MKNHPFSREAADGARLKLRESILGRTLLWCLLAALVPLLLVQIVSYVYQASTLRRDAQARINLVGEQKLRLLNLFFDDCQGDVLMLSRTPVLVRAAPELSAAVLQRGGFSSERYRAASQPPFEHLRMVVTTTGYADALLVSPAGDVLLATTARPELGTNLRTGRHRDTELTRVIEAARVTLRPAISSFRIHPPTGRAAIFVAAPMMQGRSLAGFAVLEISREAITSLTRDYAGLGATGDIELGEMRGGQFMMLTPPRDNKLPAFQSMPWNGAKDAPIVLASQGKSGSGVMTDLRGVPGLAWWTHLPQLKCGLVVRMERSEALAALAVRREMAWWTALVSAVFALAVAWLAARRSARPVQALDQGVRRIAGGDWEHRVGQEGQGEIGRLGRSFDQMLDRIKSVTASRDEFKVEIEGHQAAEAEIRQFHAELDKRLRECTADLAQRTGQLTAESEERLKTQQALADQHALVAAILNAIPYPIFVKDAGARFLICNHAYEHAFGVESESLKGQTSLDLDCLPEEERIRFHDEDVAVIRDADQRSYELTIAFADEEEHPALYSVNGFRQDDCRPGGLIGLLVDITGHKRAEQELAAARQAIEDAVREKNDLLSSMSQSAETPSEPTRLEAEPPATPALVEETLVVSDAEFAEPPIVPESEVEEAVVEPATEPESEPLQPELASKRRGRIRRAPTPDEIETPIADDLPADELPPMDSTDSDVMEGAPELPENEEPKPTDSPGPEEPPAKPAAKKASRVRKSAAPSRQQELFVMDSPRGEPPAGAPSAPSSPPAPRKVSAVPAPPSFDVKALRLSLWTLESLLRNADMDAPAELAALHPQVKGTAFEARFAALAREIAGERFESAVAELERIKTDLAE